jgi:hypothetical protein
MGLKEWGQGLEELTEYYYRYAKELGKGEKWFVTNGVIGERKKSGSRSPVEIDLIAFLIDDSCKIKKIHAIQCKEGVKGEKEADKVLAAFNVSTINELFRNARRRGILEKVVAYVEINDAAEKKLERRVKLVYLLDMVLELVDFFDMYNKQGRKGYEGEGIIWLLKRLRTHMFLPDSKEWNTNLAQVLADMKKEKGRDDHKKDPKASKGAKKAWRKMKAVRWLVENYKTKKAKGILHANPRLAEKVRKEMRKKRRR